MTTRSKDKVMAAFRKLFFRSSSDKIRNINDQKSQNKIHEINDNPFGSPSKKTRHYHNHHHNHHHRGDVVSPAENCNNVPDKPSTSHSNNRTSIFFKTKQNYEDKSHTNSGSAPSSSSRGVRLKRLMKELSDIKKCQNRQDATFTAELVNDNLFEWHVKLHKVDPESQLAADMRELGIPHILLHVMFPENFPFAPPFMRVISPRIEKGFVMEGGAICMELLTPRGWASAYTIEAVITQFAASIVKGQGRVARKPKSSKEFNRRSAEESFRSLVKTHEKYGWVTPPLAEG